MTGARFHARFELYSHERVAAQAGLSAGKIAALAAGVRPPDLTDDEAAAYNVASALSGGGQLPESTYRQAIQHFGEKGTAELIFLIAGYVQICVLLNAYDVAVPGSEENQPEG